jgi:K+-transporting ATPase KdpF subunit
MHHFSNHGGAVIVAILFVVLAVALLRGDRSL